MRCPKRLCKEGGDDGTTLFLEPSRRPVGQELLGPGLGVEGPKSISLCAHHASRAWAKLVHPPPPPLHTLSLSHTLSHIHTTTQTYTVSSTHKYRHCATHTHGDGAGTQTLPYMCVCTDTHIHAYIQRHAQTRVQTCTRKPRV